MENDKMNVNQVINHQLDTFQNQSTDFNSFEIEGLNIPESIQKEQQTQIICKFNEILASKVDTADNKLEDAAIINLVPTKTKDNEIFSEYPPLKKAPLKRAKFPFQVGVTKAVVISIILIVIFLIAANPELYNWASAKPIKMAEKKDLKKK